jgi:hypothetical protein
MNVILAFDALLSRGNLILFRPFVWIFIIYNYPYLANVTIENVSCVYSQQEKQHLRLDPITTRSVVLLQIQVLMEQVLSLWRGIVFYPYKTTNKRFDSKEYEAMWLDDSLRKA